jgi:hypothetical protein
MSQPTIRTKSGLSLPVSVLVEDILDLLDGNGAIITETPLAVYELTAYLRATLALEETAV